jgi:LysM repeat protein
MKKIKKPVFNIFLAIVVAVTALAVALPQPAQAAACDSYYFVRAGDTTVSIAQHFDMKWGVIAKANKLKYPYDLEVGQRLCIPPKDTDDDDEDEDETKFKYTATATRSAITITVSGLSTKKAVFNVRARNATGSVGGWVLLGRIKVKKGSTTKVIYTIPTELRNLLYIQVCLKNVTTDTLTCKTVVHP